MQRFLAVVVAVLVVIAVVGYVLLERRHRVGLEAAHTAAEERLEEHRADASASARELAEDVVRVLAAAVSEDVARGAVADVENVLAAAVQGHRLVGVLVATPDGTVISSTDLRYRGRVLADPASRRAAEAVDVTVVEGEPAPGQVEVVAPLVVDGETVGFLRAFVQLDEVSGS